MKAWRFVEAGRPLELQSVADPEPGPGEAIVRVQAVGLCHSDLYLIDGRWPTPSPLTLGHEGAGTVIATAPDVAEIRVGDLVAVHGANACRRCPQCIRGRTNLCEREERMGLRVDGMFAEFARCKATSLIRFPRGVSLEGAAIATDAVLTPYHALSGIGRLQNGERVAVFGLGGLGVHAVQLAKALGAAEVVGIDPDGRKREQAVAVGATRVIEDGQSLASDRVDLALDLVGDETTLLDAQHAVRNAGRIVVVGLAADTAQLVALRYGVQEVALLGAFWGTEEELRSCLDLLAEGAIRPVFETAPLDTVNEQIDRLRNGRIAGRVALVPCARL